MDYQLIDADGHYYEPDDCFSRHIESRYKDATVRVERGDDGLGRVFNTSYTHNLKHKAQIQKILND